MDTQRLRRLDIQHVWHPFTAMQDYAADDDTPIIVAGDGFYLHDSEGRRYLDGVASMWCNVHGHWVPEIDAAIREQLDLISHSTLLGLGNVPSIELAAALVSKLPTELTRVFYSDDGSTAVEAALKIAWQYSRQRSDRPGDRRLFGCLSGAYHGDTIGAVSVGGIDLFHSVYQQMLFPTVKVPAPVALRTPAGMDANAYLASCVDELETLFRNQGEQLAGFVIEPLVQAAAGILVHPPGYLARVARLCREYDVPLIADEVATAFGRVGTLLASTQENVTPDILCLSKGLTGGYLPLAATVVTDRVYEAFLGPSSEGKTFFHGHTFTGNPLACAAALASLDLFEKNDVPTNVAGVSRMLEARFERLRQHPHVAQIRHKGMAVGIELVADRETLCPFPPEKLILRKLVRACRRRGVLIRPLGDALTLMPAPGMPSHLVAVLCDTVEESLTEVLADL